MAIEVGERAPDFALPGAGGTTHRLSEYCGKTVVLVFYPGDETPVCTRQLCSYSERWDDLEGTGAVVLAISPQSVDSHAEFASHHGLRIPLLADTDRTAIAAYGV